jgi:RNA polymerase sigma-70 factor (ECF subfamily)
VSQGRRPPATDIEAEEAEGTSMGIGLRENATPESHMLADEIATTVERAVSGLPEDLRTAITLREIDGLSYEEIADVMDCPIGTVRSRIFRAREAIDAELKPLIED